MKETIILSNIKEKELLKTLAINNVVSFNTRIFNAENLAKEVLLRNGIILDKKQINTTTQECIIYNIVSKSNGYFKNSTFEDARKQFYDSLKDGKGIKGDREQYIAAIGLAKSGVSTTAYTTEDIMKKPEKKAKAAKAAELDEDIFG